MKVLDKYQNEKDQLKYVNRFLRMVIFLLILALTFNSIAVMYAINRHKVIILPPEITAPLEISGSHVSDEYLKSIVKYVAFLGLNYSSTTVYDQFNDLLKLFAPEVQDKFKVSLTKIAEDVKLTHVTSVFQLTTIKIDRSRNFVVFTGHRKVTSGQDVILKEGEESYFITYKVSNARFLLTNFGKCEGDLCKI